MGIDENAREPAPLSPERLARSGRDHRHPRRVDAQPRRGVREPGAPPGHQPGAGRAHLEQPALSPPVRAGGGHAGVHRRRGALRPRPSRASTTWWCSTRRRRATRSTSSRRPGSWRASSTSASSTSSSRRSSASGCCARPPSSSARVFTKVFGDEFFGEIQDFLGAFSGMFGPMRAHAEGVRTLLGSTRRRLPPRHQPRAGGARRGALLPRPHPLDGAAVRRLRAEPQLGAHRRASRARARSRPIDPPAKSRAWRSCAPLAERRAARG